MRIIWNIHLYPPTHNCGSEMVAHQFNKFLISKGHQVRVVLQQYTGNPYTYEGVEVFPATGNLDTFRWAQVLVTHLDFTQFTILIGLSIKRPVIHFVHNDIAYSSINNAIKSQYVVYNSAWCRDKINYPWPSVVLHPPCNIGYYNVNDKPSRNTHITLISLNERKGGELFSRIAAAMPDRKFIGVVGSYDNPGALKLTQEEIIKRMPPNVEIIANSPDILSVYRRTRVLLMPSDYESWGRTATEAMCNGIPVICTPTEGLLENCGQAADYVGHHLAANEPGDPSVFQGEVADWVTATKKYDDPKYYSKKSLLCRERAKELDPQKELEQVEDFICNARF